jgi:hypothetical protein
MIRIAITAAAHDAHRARRCPRTRLHRPVIIGTAKASSTSKQPSYAPDELALARATTDGIAQREIPEPKAVLLAMGGGRGA